MKVGIFMSIGTNIKKRRFELRMSQQDLADAMGYKTRSTIAKIESGENSLTSKKLEKMASVLDTTVEALVSGSFVVNSSFEPMPFTGSKNIAVILAGGKSSRNQQNIPNQFINVLEKPILIHATEAYQHHPAISDIYIVCLKGWEDIVSSYAQQYGITKLRKIIPGGDTGILSIKNAVDYIVKDSASDGIIIFQESTRPLISGEDISRVLKTAQENRLAVSCRRMNEYMQFMTFSNSSRALDRSTIVTAQSPEAYSISLLKETFAEAELNHHDFSETICAMFMYNMNINLVFCEGSYDNNIKIVRQEDIAIISALLKAKS